MGLRSLRCPPRALSDVARIRLNADTLAFGAGSRHMPGHYRWLRQVALRPSVFSARLRQARACRSGYLVSQLLVCSNVLRGPVWNTIPDGLFSSPSEAVSLRGVVRLPADPGGFLFIVAKMNSESMQALPKSHLCSFEPQRHHRNALSGLSHFPQLLVLLGFPYSSGVLCTPDHFISPHRRAGAPRWASSMASRIKSRSDTNATPQQNSDSTRRGGDRSGQEQLSWRSIGLAG